jgi:hypothetical protein
MVVQIVVAALLLAIIRLTADENAHLLVGDVLRHGINFHRDGVPSAIRLRKPRDIFQIRRRGLSHGSPDIPVESRLPILGWNRHRLRCATNLHPISVALEIAGQREAEAHIGGHLPASADPNYLRHPSIGVLQSGHRNSGRDKIHILFHVREYRRLVVA